MEQYISKSALVAEIERLQDAIKATAIDDRISKEHAEAYKVCVKLRSFVEDTLEVKEVDLTEEDMKLVWNLGDEIPAMSEEEFFKELLRRYKAQKGEEV